MDKNHFKLYKQFPQLFFVSSINIALYCFYGNSQQSGSKTRVSYRILPGFTIFFYYLLLTLAALYMFCQVIFPDTDLFTAVVLLGFLLLFTFITQLGKKKCRMEFEQQLTGNTHCKK